METCFKLINREYYELNKNYVEMIKQLKNISDNKNNKEQQTIINKLRLIRKMIIELTYRIEDFNESPTTSGILQDHIAITKKVIPRNCPKVIKSGVISQPAAPRKAEVKKIPPIALIINTIDCALNKVVKFMIISPLN